jgi:hypothetical protein
MKMTFLMVLLESIDWNSGCYGSIGMFAKIISWTAGIIGGTIGGLLGGFLFHWTTSWLTILLMSDAGKLFSQVVWFIGGFIVGAFLCFGFVLSWFCH